jgi:hypothetical protein
VVGSWLKGLGKERDRRRREGKESAEKSDVIY